MGTASNERRTSIYATWGLWLLWVVAGALGCLAALTAHWSVTGFEYVSIDRESAALVAGILAGSLVLAIVQGFALRMFARPTSWVRWSVLTFLGYGFSLGLAGLCILLAIWLLSNSPGPRSDVIGQGTIIMWGLFPVALVLAAGAVVGFLQSILLRPYRPDAPWWWVASNAVGAVAGIGGMMYMAWPLQITNLLLVGAVPGMMAGAITGTAISLLLKNAYRQMANPDVQYSAH